MSLLRLLLYPVASLYGIVLRVRHFLFDGNVLKAAQFQIPIICVGNITVGGTGKTPVIQMITTTLLKYDIKPAILSRGYGRKSKGYKLVLPDMHALATGDEPLMHALQFPDVTVAVAEDRAIGISEIIAGAPDTQCVLLDDAYQHRWVKPQINILLTDYNRPFFEDFLLPAGNNRDLRIAAKRAHMLIFTRTPDYIENTALEAKATKAKTYLSAHAQIYFTKMVSSDWMDLFTNNPATRDFHKAVAFAGIAQNQVFFKSIDHIQLSDCLAYSDHHTYTETEIRKLYAKIEHEGRDVVLLTTAKDAIKLRQIPLAAELLQGRIFYRDIKVSFLHGQNLFEHALLQQIAHIQNQTD